MTPSTTRRRLLAALLWTAAIALPMPAAAAADHPPLRIVTSFTVNSMNPWMDGFWMHEFGQAELLMQFREDGKHHPWLLERLDNPEPARWVMRLRQGLTFQNGKAVDAAAVLAAISAARQHSAAAQSAVPEGAQFTISGPLEITVTTPAPWPELPGVLADEMIFLILDAEAVEAAGNDWASLIGAGIYTGPYAVTGLSPAALEATAYPGYWQGSPALPGVSVRFVPDANARVLAVQNDEADIALYPPLAARPAVEAAPGMHFNIGTQSTGGFLGYMNLRQGPLADIAVRKAVMRAIDYREIAEDVFRGGMAQATGLYAANLPWALENYTTDIAAAASLLDEAGWALGSDGIRMKDGQQLSLVLAIYPQQPDLVPLSTAVQAQLARIGIAAQVVSFDGINEALNVASNRWDIAMLSNGTASYGRTLGFFANSIMPDARRNYGGYANRQISELVSTLAVEADAQVRMDLLRRIQAIFWEEDPYVFAFTGNRNRVIVGDRYSCYQPGFALYHVSWKTAPCSK